MYKATLLTQILYESMVLWPMVSRVDARSLLPSLQGSYLRAAVESTQTKPTQPLKVTLRLSGFSTLVVSTLASGTQDCGFDPSRSR
jgi:hypothetical protein